jgi:transposase
LGRRGLRIVRELFDAWHAFRAEAISRAGLQQRIAGLEHRLGRTLFEGAFGEDAKVAKFCEKLIELEPVLWTFARVEGVEPTNNFMERLVRRAVLWRLRSFDCHSEAGWRFVERILTVVQTCHLRGTSTLEYLVRAVAPHRSGQECPRLLAQC